MVAGIQERKQKHKSTCLSSAGIRSVLLARTGHMTEASRHRGPDKRGAVSVPAPPHPTVSPNPTCFRFHQFPPEINVFLKVTLH